MVCIDSFVSFFHGFICVTSGGIAWMMTVFNKSFPTFELRKPLKSLCSPYGIVSKTVWSRVFHAFLMQFTWVLSKTYSICIVPSHLVVENHEFHFTDTKIDAHFVEMQSVVAPELTRLTQRVVIVLHRVADSCITCHYRFKHWV